MSKEHITFLKFGGYIKITEYSMMEQRAKKNRIRRAKFKSEGLMNISANDINPKYKDHDPSHTPTKIKQYAPSRSYKDRLTVWLRNFKLLKWRWTL